MFNSYTKAYNRKYNHSGTIFEGRYKAKRVVKEAHLRQLCRYIHANPVKHSIVKNLEDWPYSNYLEWTGGREGSLVDREFIRDYYPDISEYQELVDDFLQTRRLAEDIDYLEQFVDM